MKTSFIHSLYFKLATGLAVILLSIGLSYIIFASYMVQQISQSSQQLINKGLAQDLVNDKKIVRDGKIDIKAMKSTFMQYMTINPSIEIYYLDLQGKILAYSAEPGKVKRNTVDLTPIKTMLQLNKKRNSQTTTDTIMGDDPRSHDVRKAFSVTQIPNSTNPEGYLYVVLQGEEITDALDKQAQNTILYLGGIVIFGSLFLALLIGLYLFYRINLRIKKLQTNVTDFIDSDFSAEQITTFNTDKLLLNDEISDLEKQFEKMVQHIQKQWSALKQQDNLRREMIANISHDLRTPLASIQGYLETLCIKYHDLDDIGRQEYLNTAAKQSLSLQKLIDGLFELAKLDAKEREPEMENFPLLELAYDVMAKFKIKAVEKNIHITLDSETENPIVYADLGLIERVLDNLINNAIYYSHNDSNIKLTIAAPENKKLTVKISDNGLGIAKDQQELVFDQFHQAHTPERTDGHAGLGLSIVKKIIELHHQKIWVESKPNQGAEFNFTLAAP